MRKFGILLCVVILCCGFIGREGGGGGGIKIGDKIFTLAQAGLKIAGAQDPYFPDPETIEAVSELITKIDAVQPTFVKGQLKEGIFGNKRSYQKVSVVDPQLFAKMNEEYAKYVERLPGQFAMLAYTEENMTYLFPDYFAAPAPTRAITLLQQALGRNPKKDLKDIFRLEEAVTTFARNPQNPDYRLKVYEAFERLQFYDISGLAFQAIYVQWLMDQGVQLKLSDFLNAELKLGQICGITDKIREVPRTKDGHTAYPTDSLVLSARRKVHEGIFKYFYGSSMVSWGPNTNGFDDRDLGCGMVNKDPSNYALSVREVEGRPWIYATAMDAKVLPVDPWYVVPEVKIRFDLPRN